MKRIRSVFLIVFIVFIWNLACNKQYDPVASAENEENSLNSLAIKTTKDFAGIYVTEGNKKLRSLTMNLARKMIEDDFFAVFRDELSSKYRFYLKEFIEKSNKGTDLLSDIQDIKSSFAEILPNFPVHIEVYLHPKYRNLKIDNNLLLSCAPVFNDSLIESIQGFDKFAQSYEVSASILPDNKIAAVVRIDEFPEEFLKENENQRKLLAAQSDTSYSYIYLWGLEWFTTDKGEKAAYWPPEYYTKSWYCYNDACTSTNGKQVYYFSSVNTPANWYPPMTSDSDMDHHSLYQAHLCWGGTNTIPRYDFKVELWERDYGEPLGDDDFLDRYVLDFHNEYVSRDGQYNVDADFHMVWY